MYHNIPESSVFNVHCYSDVLYLTPHQSAADVESNSHIIMRGYSSKFHHLNSTLLPKTCCWLGMYSSTSQELT